LFLIIIHTPRRWKAHEWEMAAKLAPPKAQHFVFNHTKPRFMHNLPVMMSGDDNDNPQVVF
jgi:hypothetical protein